MIEVKVIPIGQLVIDAFRSHANSGGSQQLSRKTSPKTIDRLMVNHIRHHLLRHDRVDYGEDLSYFQHWKERQEAIMKAYPCLSKEISQQIKRKETEVTSNIL